jgi:hypothetical protein
MRKEVLYQIISPYFSAGLSVMDGRVFEAAPIIKYMAATKWTLEKVQQYCQGKKWALKLVN